MLTLQLLGSHKRVQQVEHDKESDNPHDEVLEVHRPPPVMSGQMRILTHQRLS